jgi:acyl carrier protein
VNTDSMWSHDAIVNAVILTLSEQSGEEATMESDLADGLGLDSLDYCELAIELESVFDIGPVPDNDLFRLRTVEQLVCYVEAWKQKQLEVNAARVAEA